MTVPRSQCQQLSLDVKGVPRSYQASFVRLQLVQLVGAEKFGYAFRVDQGAARIWYWNETESLRKRSAEHGGFDGNGVIPVPEPLLRLPVGDGLHLIACDEGVEALAVQAGRVVRTRWFAQTPSAEAWQAFVRDCGLPAENVRLPEKPEYVGKRKRPAGWRIVTTWRKAWPRAAYVSLAIVTLIGVGGIVGGIYQWKIDLAIERERVKLESLRHERRGGIDLVDRIQKIDTRLSRVRQVRNEVRQLDLLAAIADSGLIVDGEKISLHEWEYRGDRLRIVFAVADEKFSLKDFLSELEAAGVMVDIRLLPDVSPGLVSVQGRVVANGGA